MSRAMIGVAVALLSMVGLRALSLVPWGAPSSDARLRLSFSARPAPVEVCRDLTDAELAARPAHMRLRTECTGHFAAYRLEVQLAGEPVLLDTLRGGGLRNDRPIHLLRELPVRAGRQRVQVQLARIDSAGAGSADTTAAAVDSAQLGDREQRERDERRRRAAESLPARAALDQMVTFEAGRVTMVTWDSEQRRLVLAGSQPR